jgi:hypothetical protein
VYFDSFITWEVMTFDRFVEKHRKDEILLGLADGEPGLYRWQDYRKHALMKGCFIGPHPMWRATLHQKHGYFNSEEFESAGDYEFWIRIAEEDNMFHIPVVLGVYFASHDTISMGDIELSGLESYRAIVGHQTPGMEIHPMSPDTIRFHIDGKYAILDRDEVVAHIHRIANEMMMPEEDDG